MSEIEVPNPKELEELKEKHFSRRVALLTAFYAVLLAITSLGGNNAAKEMMLAQQQSSDQWAFYQAKSMKGHLYKMENLRLDAILVERGATMNPVAREKYAHMTKEAAKEISKEDREKKEIGEKAKELEKERDIYKSKDPYFDLAEALLQIAIVMASIAILADSLPVFCVSIVSAAVGTVLMVNGYLLIFTLPFFK